MNDINNLNIGDYLYVLKVNQDPMIVMSCIIIDKKPTSLQQYFNYKIKLPTGDERYLMIKKNMNIEYPIKDHLNILEHWSPQSLEIEDYADYFICLNRNNLINSYIENSQNACKMWKDNIKRYKELIIIETQRQKFLTNQIYD